MGYPFIQKTTLQFIGDFIVTSNYTKQFDLFQGQREILPVRVTPYPEARLPGFYVDPQIKLERIAFTEVANGQPLLGRPPLAFVDAWMRVLRPCEDAGFAERRTYPDFEP